MKHIARAIRNAVIIVAAAIPAILADPAMRHLLSSHPALAGYLAGAVAVLEAAVHAVKGNAGGIGA